MAGQLGARFLRKLSKRVNTIVTPMLCRLGSSVFRAGYLLSSVMEPLLGSKRLFHS